MNKRVRTAYSLSQSGGSDSSSSSDSAILNERILVLVFESIKWDLPTLCATAAVNRKLHAVAKRLLWRELCVYRAPRMLSELSNGGSLNGGGRIDGGWHALAKLMFFCCGCSSGSFRSVNRPSPGHLVQASRFSKTSGRSFLAKSCKGDLLYVSDPCEHSMGEAEDDLGVYRGVFRGFMRSKTRAYLIKRQVRLDEKVRCPYCGARVWSMTAAKLVPKSAAKRLGASPDGGLEYFVCVNGHLHGMCWLVPLSSDEEGGAVSDLEDGDGEDLDCDGDGGGDCNGREDVTAK
ncbi:EID1-like F-box protein 3 [Linum perenne]